MHRPPPLDRSALRRLVTIWETRVSRLIGPLGAKLDHLPVLQAFWPERELTVAQLRESVPYTHQKLTHVLRNMQDDGFIARRGPARRPVQVRFFLTPEGQALQEAASAAILDVDEAAVEGFNPDERVRFWEFVQRATENLEPAAGER